ncbi:MAG: ROK family transcriptional regulator [Rubellimicrobium sp.]|nr:ROK family transcriptional regulator [Rubellimicrobium sp.]
MTLSVTANPSRQMSFALAMQAIIHGGPISRASIAKQTGMSKQTVSEIVRILEDGGWVQETGRTSGHVGRSATTYELVPNSALIAAVDLGGTKLRVALADLSGRVLSELVEPTHPDGGAAVARQIARLVDQVRDAAGIAADRLRLTVVGCPGVPDPATGAVRYAPNIAGIDRIDFRASVSQATGTPVTLENDVNLAVLGEQWLGAGQGIDHLVFIALGTGIGAGIVAGGELLRGATGAAGELGYLPFGADPFEDASLRIGAFERVAATAGIREAYLARTGTDRDVPAIFDAAATGDPAAREVIAETGRQLARAVAAVAAVTAPELVILGGSIGARPEILAATQTALARCFPFPVRLAPSALGPQAALAGAVAIGLTELHTALFARTGPGATIALPAPPTGLLHRAAE